MPLTPIEKFDVVPLFPEMRTELLRILEELDDNEWSAPTACEGWSVKDVASHLLADDLGYLSRHRDQDGITASIESWDDLLRFINSQNEAWVDVTRRISRRLLIQLLQFTGSLFQEYVNTCNPNELARPISWAGNQPVPMWLQVAREYTEYWMHHQHIADAVGRTSLRETRYVVPLLKTFIHALPHTYRETSSPLDTAVEFVVHDVEEAQWTLLRQTASWGLYQGIQATPPTSRASMDLTTAWKLFTKGLSREEAIKQITIEGDYALGSVVLNTVAILA